MTRILIDSASDYMFAEAKEKNIDFIPISVNLGNCDYLDGIDLERDEFFELMEKTGDFPKTSQPSPQAFMDVFTEVKNNGDDIVCILLSSELSGTCQSAMIAKNLVDYDKIYIVDSLSATYPIKIMADYACKLRSEGLSGKDIADKVEELKPRVKVIAALDTLEYLQRGGRLSKTAATIGEMVNLKPIVTLTEDGVIGILGKSIGKNKAISSILKTLNSVDIDSDFPVHTIYSYGSENCSKLEEKLAAQNYAIKSRLQIGSSIGSHIGPEAFGIIYVKRS